MKTFLAKKLLCIDSKTTIEVFDSLPCSARSLHSHRIERNKSSHFVATSLQFAMVNTQLVVVHISIYIEKLDIPAPNALQNNAN